jgi:predicted RNA-binding Zn-ribbon protein involved in translation (DUF1610 family)
MDGDEAERGAGSPAERAQRIAAGQVWIACALCGRPVELSDAVETAEGHVCPQCGLGV